MYLLSIECKWFERGVKGAIYIRAFKHSLHKDNLTLSERSAVAQFRFGILPLNIRDWEILKSGGQTLNSMRMEQGPSGKGGWGGGGRGVPSFPRYFQHHLGGMMSDWQRQQYWLITFSKFLISILLYLRKWFTLYTLTKHLLLMHENRKHYICICTRQQVKTKPAQRSQLQYSRGVWNKFKDKAVTQKGWICKVPAKCI